MRLRWYTIVIDCRDIHAQARWWSQVLGGTIIHESEDEVVLLPGAIPEEFADGAPVPAERWTQVPPGLVFVPVPELKQTKNRLHIDLAPHADDDRDAQIAQLLDAGARRVDVGQGEDASFTVLADPEGNEFCVLSSRTM